MVATVGAYLKSWVFLPDPPASDPGPYDFKVVSRPSADNQNDDCSICMDPLFSNPVAGHRPPGRGIDQPLSCHFHIECLADAFEHKEACPLCRTPVDPQVIARILDNLPLSQRISRFSRKLWTDVKASLPAIAVKTAMIALLFLLPGAISSLIMLGTSLAGKFPLAILLPRIPVVLASLPLGVSVGFPVTSLIFKAGDALLFNNRLTRTAKVISFIALAALATLAVIKITSLIATFLSTKYLSILLPPSELAQGMNCMGLSWEKASALGFSRSLWETSWTAHLFQLFIPLAAGIGIGVAVVDSLGQGLLRNR